MGISQADIGSELDVDEAVIRQISVERHLRTPPPGSGALASEMPELRGSLSGSESVENLTGVNTSVDRALRAIGARSLPAATGSGARYCTRAVTENRVAVIRPLMLSVMVGGGALAASTSMRNRTMEKHIATIGQAGFGIPTIIECDRPVCRNRKVDRQVAGGLDSTSGCVNKRLTSTNPKNRPGIPKKAHTRHAGLEGAWVTFPAASVRAESDHAECGSCTKPTDESLTRHE